ncbi:MAG: hypothetical protein HY267_02415 [Deltaproteobacteria bacterium]|nr:hypothetical protein [Deltaproteobacteria bacterium]
MACFPIKFWKTVGLGILLVHISAIAADSPLALILCRGYFTFLFQQVACRFALHGRASHIA